MAAIVPTTKTPAHMILGGKDQKASLKIEFSRQKALRNAAARFRAMVLQHAVTADADFIPRLFRHFCEQCFRYFHTGTPARAFVSVGRAELAVVGSTAKRATVGVTQIHCFDLAPANSLDAVKQSILINASVGPSQPNNSGFKRWASNSVPSMTRGPGRLK
jgi:hypothetical protein